LLQDCVDIRLDGRPRSYGKAGDEAMLTIKCVICGNEFLSRRESDMTCSLECCKKNKALRRKELRAMKKNNDIGINLLRLPGRECPKEDAIDGQAAEFDQSMIYLCECGAPFIPYEIRGRVVDKCPDCMRTIVVGKHFSRGKLQPTMGMGIGGMV